MEMGIGMNPSITVAATSTPSLATVTAAIWAIELDFRTESAKLAKTRIKISHSTLLLAENMTTAITVTAENTAIRTATRRNTPTGIEPATSLVFVGTRVL